MTLKRLSKHLDAWHDLFLDAADDCTLDNWLRADEEWQDLMKTHPPNPHPCDYDSKKGGEDSENSSQSEEEKEEATTPGFTIPPHRMSHSDSSSDSSSSKNPGPQKRLHTKVDNKLKE